MEEKKSFFELLDPKNALIVGVIGGLLTLGTLGFIVLGILFLKGDVKFSAISLAPTVAPVANQLAAQPAPTPPANIPKTDRPKVELFVMSYCPFGLQMQKAYAPAWELLEGKADIDVKFVSYAMHELKEVEENTRQYCIEQEEPSKYIAYLKCFTTSGDYKSCMSTAAINTSKIDRCYTATDKKFGVMAEYNNKSKWLSGRFPVYPIHQKLNDTYGVQGSPTLIINGVLAEVGRTPEAVKQAICAAFTNPPVECGQPLSNLAFQPGFGAGQAAAAGATQPGCGT